MDNQCSEDKLAPTFDSDEYRREALKVSALLLRYPDEAVVRTLREIRDWAVALMPATRSFTEAVNGLLKLDEASLQRLYVDTFDFAPETSLFLTSHEYGDSRERGTELIQLLRLLARAGFVPANGEMADSLPLLLEFLASKPSDMDTSDLEVRLAALCGYLVKRIGENHAYQKVLIAVGEVLPSVSQEQVDDLETTSRSASVDDESDMPYPLFYDDESKRDSAFQDDMKNTRRDIL